MDKVKRLETIPEKTVRLTGKIYGRSHQRAGGFSKMMVKTCIGEILGTGKEDKRR